MSILFDFDYRLSWLFGAPHFSTGGTAYPFQLILSIFDNHWLGWLGGPLFFGGTKWNSSVLIKLSNRIFQVTNIYTPPISTSVFDFEHTTIL